MAPLRTITRSEQPQSFCDGNLPRTIEIARLARKHLPKGLGHTTVRWPFEDRVLVMLVPGARDHVKRFHLGEGGGLVEWIGTARRDPITNLDRQLMADLVSMLRDVLPHFHALVVASTSTRRTG